MPSATATSFSMTTPYSPVLLSAQVFLDTTMVRHCQWPSIIIPLTKVSRPRGIYCSMQIRFYSLHHQGIHLCASLVASTVHRRFNCVFRREEAPLYLTASVSPLVGRSVGWSVPTTQLRGKLVTSRLFREEEEEEENWSRRSSFAPRD
jgi:hypothetical protein